MTLSLQFPAEAFLHLLIHMLIHWVQ